MNKISSKMNENYKVSVEGTVMSEGGTGVKGEYSFWNKVGRP